MTYYLLCLTVSNKSKSSVAAACFFPGRAKDLSAPLYKKFNISNIRIKLKESYVSSSCAVP